MLWLAYVMADLCYAERSFLTCVVLSPQVFEQNHYFFGFTKIVFFLFGLTSQILHQDLTRCAVKQPFLQCPFVSTKLQRCASYRKKIEKQIYGLLQSFKVHRSRHDFLQICMATVFGKRALFLHILKLSGRPRQGP